jgi:hypothetical protein
VIHSGSVPSFGTGYDQRCRRHGIRSHRLSPRRPSVYRSIGRSHEALPGFRRLLLSAVLPAFRPAKQSNRRPRRSSHAMQPNVSAKQRGARVTWTSPTILLDLPRNYSTGLERISHASMTAGDASMYVARDIYLLNGSQPSDSIVYC